MANVTGFNHDLDKITERELVYDIYSRIKSGKDLKLKNEIYSDNNNTNTFTSIITNNGPETTIFNKKTFIKDIDKKILSTIDTNIVNYFGYKDANELKMVKILIRVDTNTSKRFEFLEYYNNRSIYHTNSGVYVGGYMENVSSVIGDDNHKLKFNNNPKRIRILVYRDPEATGNNVILHKAYFESNHIDITNLFTVEKMGSSNVYAINLDLDTIDFTNDDYLRIYYQ